MPHLVVFSHLRWNFVFQRPQHLLSRLVRHYHVVFVEEPVHVHPNVLCLPSAVDAAHYSPANEATVPTESSARAAALQDAIPGPRLGFFGEIDERLDIDLVAALADAERAHRRRRRGIRRCVSSDAARDAAASCRALLGDAGLRVALLLGRDHRGRAPHHRGGARRDGSATRHTACRAARRGHAAAGGGLTPTCSRRC